MRKFTTIVVATIAIVSCVACAKAKKDAQEEATQVEFTEPQRNIP